MSLSYDNVKVLENLNVRASYHEVLCLLGPNGAGKTSLIKILCGLLKPDTGMINFFDTSGKAVPFSKKRIGYCPQKPSVWYDLTCHEQLLFLSELYGLSKREGRSRVDLLLETLHLKEKKNVLAGKLSGGMQQSLNLAMALVNDPDILVMDEPFAGLDIQVRIHIRQMLCSFAHSHGNALILSTHNIDEAEKFADRVVIMNHGAVYEIDSSEIIHPGVSGGFIIEVVLKDATEEQTDTAAEEILKLGATVVCLQQTLLICTNNKEATLEKTLEIFKDQGLTSVKINVRNRSLEDLFIELKGMRFE